MSKTSNGGMKIISLTAENVKRLNAIEIKPDGNLVEIAGRNAQGKTSVLDSILYAISGARGIPTQPIRRGKKEASITLDLGKFIVKRTFVSKEQGFDTRVTVESADGALFKSPQAMLDTFFDTLSFDPLAFSRMEPKKQFESLRRFVPDVDFDHYDGMHFRDFEERKDWNRRAKEAKGAAAQIVVPDDTPAEPINEDGLVAELEDAGKHNEEIETTKREIKSLEANKANLEQDARDFRERAAKLRAEADEEEAKAVEYEKEAADIATALASEAPLKAPIDTTAIRERIKQARAVNQQVTFRKGKEQLLNVAEGAEAKAKEITERMEARQAEKREKIAAAKMPVEGLGFGDGIVTFNGIPFEQASDAEQLRASIAIAMAGNPTLRVIRVRDGSLLDEDGMKILAEMADANDMQVWIERVSTEGKTQFVIEDGRLKGVEPEKEEEETKEETHEHGGEAVAHTPLERDIELVGAP